MTQIMKSTSSGVAVHFIKVCVAGQCKGQVIKDYYNFNTLTEAMAYVASIEASENIPMIIGGSAYVVRFESLSESIAA